MVDGQDDAHAQISSGISPLAARILVAREEQLGLHEVRRVVGLRRARRLTAEEAEEVSRAEVDPAFFDGTHPESPRGKDGKPKPFRLWRQQADTLFGFESEGGAFVNLKVGGGKTGCAFLCVKRAHQPKPIGKGIRRSLLVVPARGFRKLVELDLPKMRKILRFDVPVHPLGGLSPDRRLQLARSGLAGVYCTTYTLLQRPQAAEELKAISPQLAVCDEAHVFSNSSTFAAMKRRFFRMLDETRAMAVWLSGTMSRKSFLDAWPLFVYALRERAPVPLDPLTAQLWAQVLDPSKGAKVDLELLASMEPLRAWALEVVRAGLVDATEVGGPLSPDADGLRRAFRVRRNAAPGVVSTGDMELGTTLVIANEPCFGQAGTRDDPEFVAKVQGIEDRCDQMVPRPTPEDFVPSVSFAAWDPFDKMIALLWAIRTRWRTPNGDEIEYAIHTWQGQMELSAGFYNELVWPTADDLVSEWRIQKDEAEDLLVRAKQHRAAVRRFVREMRQFLQGEHVTGLDTPLLIWAACTRHDRRLPDDLYQKWLGVRAAEFEGMPQRRARTARVCDWKIRAAVDWAKEVEADEGRGVGGLVWCWNNEMLEWTREVFVREFGEDRVLYCPAGKVADRAISDPTASAHKFTIASIGAHCEIKDLFHFRHQVFIQFPRPANTAEQVLGRTHRYGQQADELVVRTLLTTEFDLENYSATLLDAMWLSQAETPHKIIHADYDPLPALFPSKFLQERGFQLESADQDSALRLALGADGGGKRKRAS